MNALDILINAKKVLKSRYCEGELATEDGHYCALGAVNKVAHIEQKYYPPLRNGTPVERAVFFLENAVTGEVPDPQIDLYIDKDVAGENYSFDVININDTYGKEAALAVFDRAISNCRRRHLSKTPFNTEEYSF